MERLAQGNAAPVQSILRIYLGRRPRPKRGFFKSLFASPLSHELVKDALVSGITYATVTVGHSGYIAGAKTISEANSEVAIETLPTCVELVAPRPALQAFLNDHSVVLSNAVVLWLEGVLVSSS